MSNKLRLAIFLGGYLPAKKYGGPVTSIANLVENLGDELDIYIISNDHDLDDHTRLPDIQEGWNTVGKAKVLYIPESEYGKKRFVRILKEIKADLVYLSSVFYYQMNLPAIIASKTIGIPILLAPRGELCEGAMRIGTNKKRLYLAVAKIMGLFSSVNFHTTSEEEKREIQKIFGAKCGSIFNIPNMSCPIEKKRHIKKEPGIVRVTYISRIVRKKNLLFAIQCINKTRSKVLFDIYGPKEDPVYWDECQSEISKAPGNVSITYNGTIDPGASKEVFKEYHAFVFPTLSENYGHVIAEALAAGCHPVISSGTTPWDDLENNGGYVIPLSQPDEWAKVIDQIALFDQEKFDAMRDKLDAYTNKKLMVDKLKNDYIYMFESIRNRK